MVGFFFLANLYILALNDILFISVILIVNNKMTEILYNWDFVTNRITSEEEIGERRRSSAISVSGSVSGFCRRSSVVVYPITRVYVNDVAEGVSLDRGLATDG